MKKGMVGRWVALNAVLAVAILATAGMAWAAQDSAAKPDAVAELTKKVDGMRVQIDTVWTLVTAFLVFFMNLGFACVEAGFCRAKNAVNILSKNFIVFAASTLGFWVLGWGLMFGNDGGETGQGWIGTTGLWLVSGNDADPAKGDYSSIAWTTVPLWTKFLFQLVFCGTAATIVSGCVAERIKYQTFIIFSILMAVVIYPVVGHWVWGGGWLQDRGFADFAGSTQVHSIGGWAGLAGIIVLGPRIGKYSADGKVNPIAGHSMMAGTIGTFVLWFGWFGFNPGSTMGAADAVAMGEIAVTTNTAAALATLTATITSWVLMGKPDLGMTLNGCLAGLVAITAPCAFVTVNQSAIIGAIAGVLVVFSVLFWDKLKIDDPVGALSVHLANGVFGTLCVGLFSDKERIQGRTANPATSGGILTGGGSDQLVDQLIGIASVGAYVLVISFVCWFVLKAAIGLRVSAEEETQGLDIGEHGQEAYSGFQMIQK